MRTKSLQATDDEADADARLLTKSLAPHLAGLKIKADGAPGSFTGYASVWGVVDAYNERVMPGSVTPSLNKHRKSGSKVRMFWSHDPRAPLGRWTDIAEDKKGLFVAGQLNLEVALAKDIHALMKDESVDGLSIGYRVVSADEASDGVLELNEIDLLEVSLVSLPANPRATVDTVKSAGDAYEKFVRLCTLLREGQPPPAKEFERVLRDAGVPKSVATDIASRGYASVFRSDSEDMEAVHSTLREVAASFKQ